MFGNGHKNVFFFQTTRPIRLIFGMKHQSNDALSGSAPLLHSSSVLELVGTIDRQIRHFLHNFFVKNYPAERTEIDMVLEHVKMPSCARHGDWILVSGLLGHSLI